MANEVIKLVDRFAGVWILSAPLRRRILHVHKPWASALLNESDIPTTNRGRSGDDNREQNQIEQTDTADVGHEFAPDSETHHLYSSILLARPQSRQQHRVLQLLPP